MSAPSRRGDPDAAFNLGVLVYEAGDFEAAEAAWRRSAGRGHVRAAANLLFLSRHRRESEADPAIQSEARGLAEFEELYYRRADESGAATGAFNLGAMLHSSIKDLLADKGLGARHLAGDPDVHSPARDLPDHSVSLGRVRSLTLTPG
ncbi:MAG: hypothetical protein ACXVH3_35195 [Solirubrobacteraceae bacterium]